MFKLIFIVVLINLYYLGKCVCEDETTTVKSTSTAAAAALDTPSVETTTPFVIRSTTKALKASSRQETPGSKQSERIFSFRPRFFSFARTMANLPLFFAKAYENVLNKPDTPIY